MSATRPASRPNRALAASKRERYVNTGEASRLLGGLISAGMLRQMALAGEIVGAVKPRHARAHVLIPRHVVDSLVDELEYQAPTLVAHRPQPNTFDRTG